MVEAQGLRLRTSVTALLFSETDWRATPLGPVNDWAASLRIAVQTCLNARMPMTVCLGDALHLVYNDACLPILAHKHPTGFGRPVLEVFEDISDFLAAGAEQVLGRQRTLQGVNQLLPLHRNGRVREGYFTFSYSPLLDADGSPVGVLTTAHETTHPVTDARRQQTLTRLSTQLIQTSHQPDVARFRDAFAGNPMDLARVTLFSVNPGDALEARWHIDHSGHYQARSHQKAARRAQFRFARLDTDETAMEEVADRTFALMLRASGLRSDGFILIVEPDPLVGIDRSYLAFLDILREVAGGGVHRSLAERQTYSQLRDQIDQRTDLYRLLFEHTGEAIVLSDTNGRILAANPAACRLTQYSEEALIELGHQGLIEPGSVSDLDAGIQRLLAEGRRQGTLRLRRRDGSQLEVDLTSTTLAADEDAPVQIISILRDASERTRAEQRLASTARLQALGQLTSGISQDYNDLLGVILLGAELLEQHLSHDEEAESTARLVVSAALRAADLTRQLLTFSQKRPMHLELVDVGQLLDELAQALRRMLGNRIKLRLHHHDRITLRTDASQLHNALLNLALNARDAMPDGGTLELMARQRLLDSADARALDVPPGDYLALTVRDDGVGIPQQQLRRVIEPFFTSKPQGKGTGLGLSMVYGFARQSGGQLVIDSEPGRGTRVELLLPDDHVAVPQDQPTHDAGQPWSCRPQEQPRILLMEQNPILADMLVRALAYRGYTVHRCADLEALKQVLAKSVDDPTTLLIDSRLLDERQDSAPALRACLRQHDELAVMLMSGRQTASLDDMASGHVLIKPFRSRALLDFLDNGPGHATNRTPGGGGAW